MRNSENQGFLRLFMVLIAVVAGFQCFASSVIQAADHNAIVPSLDKRYGDAKFTETPDFQKHVVPLISRLGCNGRACHGSFQGQGGFRLSLFGYDFKMDHEALSERLDTDAPGESYLLEKALTKIEHKGGKIFDENSWEHRVFLNWVKGGAKSLISERPAKLKALEVSPSEFIFTRDAQKTQVKAIAVWDDGTREDVTPLCRFVSNDTSIVEIDHDGELTSQTELGDTHVVLFYDSAVIPIPVIRPVSKEIGSKYPHVATRTEIDKHVVNKLRKIGIIPSEVCTDSEFLRRISLDLTGQLPTSSEVVTFLNDKSPTKRSDKIDELLNSEAYVAWWTTKLCDITGNNLNVLQNATINRTMAGKEWYDWIFKRVAANVPYDDIVEGIVMANSFEDGEDYYDYCVELSSINHKNSDKTYADRSGLTHYWARRNFRTNEERAIGFAYTFLGIRIECAQCHKHPFDQWTQEDFKKFQGFFAHTRLSNPKTSGQEVSKIMAQLDLKGLKGNQLQRELAKYLAKGKTVPFPYVQTRTPVARKSTNYKSKSKNKNKGRVVPSEAKLLGEEIVDLTKFEDPRQPLMDWMRTSDNKLMAKAYVNRVWAGYFNTGIVQPTDDLSLANPPINVALFEYLTDGFIENGYDMKWLHREITNSDTYQRSWVANSTNKFDKRNFSHSIPRRLPAEVAVDAIKLATSSTEMVSKYRNNIDNLNIASPSVGRNDAYSLTIFGRSIRESNCDCDRSSDPSLLQTIYLRNDQEVLSTLTNNRSSWLSEVADQIGEKFTGTSGPTNKNDGKYNDRVKKTLSAFQKQLSQYKNRLKLAEKKNDKSAILIAKKQISKLQGKIASFKKANNIGKPAVVVAKNEDKAGEQPKTNTKLLWKNEDATKYVKEAYLRTLSRYPTDQEITTSLDYLNSKQNRMDGLEGLMWALVNTKEFIVNH